MADKARKQKTPKFMAQHESENPGGGEFAGCIVKTSVLDMLSVSYRVWSQRGDGLGEICELSVSG